MMCEIKPGESIAHQNYICLVCNFEATLKRYLVNIIASVYLLFSAAGIVWQVEGKESCLSGQ